MSGKWPTSGVLIRHKCTCLYNASHLGNIKNINYMNNTKYNISWCAWCNYTVYSFVFVLYIVTAFLDIYLWWMNWISYDNYCYHFYYCNWRNAKVSMRLHLMLCESFEVKTIFCVRWYSRWFFWSHVTAILMLNRTLKHRFSNCSYSCHKGTSTHLWIVLE